MLRRALLLLAAVWLVGCSTRSVVVAPEQLPTRNDPKWTVHSEPAPRPR
jgi:hypothetical protein